MESVKLSKRNAFRVLRVKSLDSPELGVMDFEYNGYKNDRGAFMHTAIPHGVDAEKIIIPELKMKDFDVVEFRELEATLDEYWDDANRAYYWSSFKPEERALSIIREHEAELNNDLKEMPEDEKERYVGVYKKRFSAWLHAMSGCASSAVTGPARFNVRKAEAANNRERLLYQEFRDWREKELRAIKKRIENSKPEEQKKEEAWISLRKDIAESADAIHGINTKQYFGSKSLFVASIYGKVERYARKGDVEITQRAVDFIREMNEMCSKIITERHKFFGLVELAEKCKSEIEETKKTEDKEFDFNGGKVVYNYAEDRLQLLFDDKPSQEIISQLKKNGFRWSPRFGAWQRQLTSNAISATKRFLKENNLFSSESEV